jgi:hypothetical protein
VVPIAAHIQTTSGSFTTTMIASFTDGLHYELTGSIFAQNEQPVIDFSNAMNRAQKAVSEFHYLSARAYLMHEANLK